MKHLTNSLLLALIVTTAAAHQARAGEVEPLVRTASLGTLIDAKPMNGAASTLTFYVGPTVGSYPLLSFSTLVLRVDYTHATNGAITATCTEGDSTATATRRLTTCSVAGGTCTLSFGGVITSPVLTGDSGYTVPMRITGSRVIKCVMSHGGTAAAGDVITVSGELIGSGV